MWKAWQHQVWVVYLRGNPVHWSLGKQRHCCSCQAWGCKRTLARIVTAVLFVTMGFWKQSGCLAERTAVECYIACRNNWEGLKYLKSSEECEQDGIQCNTIYVNKLEVHACESWVWWHIPVVPALGRLGRRVVNSRHPGLYSKTLSLKENIIK
jgi:hypothetical protein